MSTAHESPGYVLDGRARLGLQSAKARPVALRTALLLVGYGIERFVSGKRLLLCERILATFAGRFFTTTGKLFFIAEDRATKACRELT